MNKIQSEEKASHKYDLKTIKGQKSLVELSEHNVAIVEAMIRNDSDYRLSSDVNAAPNNKYKGSTAYWMARLKTALLTQSANIKDIIKETILAVDRENSTHITADSIGPDVLMERIYNHHKTLIDELKDRKKGFQLIEELSRRTAEEKSISKDGKTYHPRENYSFATKFCHYACFFFFDNDKEREYQDNYSIYDGVVGKILPTYLKEAKITKKNRHEYKKKDFDSAEHYNLYSDLIDQLRKDEISRNGFDHLLWYYHKARLSNSASRV